MRLVWVGGVLAALLCLVCPVQPVSNLLASRGGASFRSLLETSSALRARARLAAATAAFATAGGDIICTQTLKASFRTMFLVQDDSLRVAEDDNGLCDLCVKVTRFGVMNVNDARYRANFKQIMRDRACHFEETDRVKDCKRLTDAILTAQTDWFTSDAAKLVGEERNSTLALGIHAQQKSEAFCRNARCCRRFRPEKTGSVTGKLSEARLQNLTNITSNAVWANLSPEQQRQVVAEDRAAMDRDKELLDNMKENLDRFQDRLNKFRAKILDKEKNVSFREKQILTGVLQERMQAKAKAMEELAAMEAQRLLIQQELDDKQAAEDERLAKSGKPRAGARTETPEERDARIARMKARKKKKEVDEAMAIAEKKRKEQLAIEAAKGISTPAPSSSSPVATPSAPSFRSLSPSPSPSALREQESDDAEDGDDDEEGAEESASS